MCGRVGCSNLPRCTFYLDDVRTAHLQRHLSAKYIEQSRSFDECRYNSQPSTKLSKIVSLGFLLFLQRLIKNGNKRKNGTLSVEQNFLSPALLTLERAERVPIDPLSL